jgi:hypothetical protein
MESEAKMERVIIKKSDNIVNCPALFCNVWLPISEERKERLLRGEVEKFVCDCGKVFEVQVETEV